MAIQDEAAPTSLIAIVDDDRAVRDALQRMLRSHGLSTKVFCSAQQFLAEAGHLQAACLIADVCMPGMSGIALYKQLTVDGVRLPMILITARPMPAEEQRAGTLGAAYLAKPLAEQILLDTVRSALNTMPGSGRRAAIGQERAATAEAGAAASPPADRR